jgi:hypothetical protein
MVCSRWTTDGVTCPPAGSFRPTPRPSCRRRARTRTCAPRAPRHQSARDSSRRRTPGPARPGICTPCAGSSSDLQSGSRRWTSPLGARCMPPARCVNLSGFTGSVPSSVHPPLRNRRACPRRRGERPSQRSWSNRRSEHERRAAGTARRPRDRTVSIEEERRSVPVAVGGELRVD